MVELHGTIGLAQHNGTRLVLNGDRHVQHLDQPLSRRHGALHHRILDRQGSDRIEKPLDIKQKRHHHPDIQMPAQNHPPAQHHHQSHGQTGQRIHHRHQNLRQPGPAQLVDQIGGDLGAIQPGIQRLAPHGLHGADRVNTLCQRTVHRRVRLMRLDERIAGQRQPEDARDEQHGQDRQRDQPKAGVQVQHQGDDAEQQHDITDRQHGCLQKLLHRPDIALQPRHQPPHLGLVHEGQRHPLQMGKHGAANVEQHILGGLADHGFLHMARDEVQRDHDGKHPQRDLQHAHALRPPHHALVDGMADDHRDRQLRQGENQYRPDRDHELAAVGLHKAADPPDDLRVENLAEHLLLDPVAADHGAQCRRTRGGFAVGLIVLRCGIGHSPSRSAPLVCRSYNARYRPSSASSSA